MKWRTYGATLTTQTGNQHLVVLLQEVQATVTLIAEKHEYKNLELKTQNKHDAYRNEGRDLLAVLDQLHADTLANGRVRLLGLHTATFNNEHLSSLSFYNTRENSQRTPSPARCPWRATSRRTATT